MASWSDFAAADPSLAAGIRALFQQYGPGMAYLATVRPDGSPRLHPVSPVITADGLYCFIINSPKRHDLEHDGRYALHSYPPEESDDEAYLTGHAHRIHDRETIAHLSRDLNASLFVDWHLYEFTITAATLRRHGPTGALPFAPNPPITPLSRSWHAPTPRPLSLAS